MDRDLNIKEIIVVEGRDDTARLKEIEGLQTIETHGFGITKNKWIELEKAYNELGLIIFTDPDHAGEEIRKKLKKQFPLAKEAFLSRQKAEKGGNIGIENAKKEDIIDALKKAKKLWDNDITLENGEKIIEKTVVVKKTPLTEKDLIDMGLIGQSNSKEKRIFVADSFGFGYANGKKILEKINVYGITKEEIIKKLEKKGNLI